MEKPSTKKPMNILKTMVFLKNFMILAIITMKKFHDCEEYYREYEELEIETYRWDHHQLEFVVKGDNRFRKLERNQEIAKFY